MNMLPHRLARAESRAAALQAPGVDLVDRARHDWYATSCPCGLEPGQCSEHPRARAAQRPPGSDWRTFVYMAGRGSGKTRAGAEFVIDRVQRGLARAPLLIGQTSADVRDIMVATILDISPPWFRPRYYPSRRALVWPNGTAALLISAEDPEQARGPNADLVWADEMGAWTRARETWRNVSLALRKGSTQAFVTTTPRRVETLVNILAQPTTVVSTESTLANRQNLSPEFVEQVLALYQGTSFYEQEVEGRMVDRLEGAWFGGFSELVHVSDSAVFDPGKPVILGIDCGTSRTTAAVFAQTEKIDKYRVKFTIFQDYLAIDRYSAENAWTILRLLPLDSTLQCVWVDPAASARTSIGATALQEYCNVFGERFVHQSPPGPVTDSLDMLTGLIDRRDIIINPSCKGLIDGLKNYARESRGGEYLDIPKANQSPWEDPVDAIRYLIRGHWPEGRKLQPLFHRVSARKLI
jgi:hypothetical protein